MFELSARGPRIVFALTALLVGLFLFAPIYWLIISAFKGNAELYRVIPTLWPTTPTLDHFRTAFTRGDLFQNLWNSLIVSGGAALLNTILAAYAGYALAKFRFSGRRPLMIVLLSAQATPFGLLLITIYPSLVSLDLLDTHLGLILASIVFALPVSIYMMFSYFSQVPGELIDAARADGAGEARILHTIVLPISFPALITVFLYAFMWSWNDLLYSMTLIVSENKRTIGPGLLLNYLNETNADWGGAMAASIVASLPILVAFAIVQRSFIQGVTAGAVK
jgi:multiple sugar transport system permease protein